MTDSTSSLSLTFSVDYIGFQGTPVARPIFNEFDSFGQLLGLDRLPEERNRAYKKRLLDVFARRASATYVGLLNGITRELGLEFYKPIQVVRNSGIDPSLTPGIEFLENKVIIYSDKPSAAVEMELNRSDPAGDAYFLRHLASYVNTNSSYFTITILDSDYEMTRTDCIINQSTAKLVNNSALRASHLQVLGHTWLEPGSLAFTDTRTFALEVDTETDVNAPGKYYVDYANGRVKSYTVPSAGARVRYVCHVTDFKPVATPVIIRNLQSDDFKEQVFQQIMGKDGETSNGLPSAVGADIINELISVTPMYWGE